MFTILIALILQTRNNQRKYTYGVIRFFEKKNSLQTQCFT